MILLKGEELVLKGVKFNKFLGFSQCLTQVSTFKFPLCHDRRFLCTAAIAPMDHTQTSSLGILLNTNEIN